MAVGGGEIRRRGSGFGRRRRLGEAGEARAAHGAAAAPSVAAVEEYGRCDRSAGPATSRWRWRATGSSEGACGRRGGRRGLAGDGDIDEVVRRGPRERDLALEKRASKGRTMDLSLVFVVHEAGWRCGWLPPPDRSEDRCQRERCIGRAWGRHRGRSSVRVEAELRREAWRRGPGMGAGRRLGPDRRGGLQ